MRIWQPKCWLLYRYNSKLSAEALIGSIFGRYLRQWLLICWSPKIVVRSGISTETRVISSSLISDQKDYFKAPTVPALSEILTKTYSQIKARKLFELLGRLTYENAEGVFRYHDSFAQVTRYQVWRIIQLLPPAWIIPRQNRKTFIFWDNLFAKLNLFPRFAQVLKGSLRVRLKQYQHL